MEIAEMDAGGAILRRFVPGGAIDSRVAMLEGAGTADIRYYHADRLGNVAAISDGTGRISERYAYDPFGNECALDASGQCVAGPPSASGNPFRYTGRRYDPETGLYFYRARYYDAKLGRFLSTDPIGYEDQWNLYAYVANDPANFSDPNGTDRTPVGDFLRGGIGVADAYRHLGIHAANKTGSPEQRTRASRIEGAIGVGFQIARNNPLETAEAFGTALNNQGLAYFGGRVAANSGITYLGVRRLGGKSNATKTVAALGISGINLTATQAGSILSGFYKLDEQLQNSGLDLGDLSGQAVSELVGPLAAGTSVNFDQESRTVSLKTKVSIPGSRLKRTVTTEICTFDDDGTCKR